MGVCRICQGRPNILGGWRVACREAACDAWRSQAFAREVREHASQRNVFFKWCNLVRFVEHIFIIFLLEKNLKIFIFYHKFFIRTYQQAPIVQHYTYNTIKTNNYIHISCTHIGKGELYITSAPNSGHHQFN